MLASRFRRLPLARRGGLVALAATAAIVLTGCGTADRDDLASDVEHLHSTGAEGVLLARQAAHGGPPVVFVWLQSAELEHQAYTVYEKLDGQLAQDDVTEQFKSAEAIALQESVQLGTLHREANHPSIAAIVRARLNRATIRAEALYERLR